MESNGTATAFFKALAKEAIKLIDRVLTEPKKSSPQKQRIESSTKESIATKLIDIAKSLATDFIRSIIEAPEKVFNVIKYCIKGTWNWVLRFFKFDRHKSWEAIVSATKSGANQAKYMLVVSLIAHMANVFLKEVNTVKNDVHNARNKYNDNYYHRGGYYHRGQQTPPPHPNHQGHTVNLHRQQQPRGGRPVYDQYTADNVVYDNAGNPTRPFTSADGNAFPTTGRPAPAPGFG